MSVTGVVQSHYHGLTYLPTTSSNSVNKRIFSGIINDMLIFHSHNFLKQPLAAPFS